MNELQEKAENYAAEKMNELMVKAIAKAYADGYNDGYKQCSEDYDIDLYEDVDFVDLGLPSGLLWSSKYRKDDEGAPLYLTYEEAAALDIPTEEQFFELVNCCKWEHIMGDVDRGGYSYKQPVGKYCEGDNGEYIRFHDKGMKYIGSGYVPHGIRFWIRDDEDDAEKKSVYIDYQLSEGTPIVKIEKVDAAKAIIPVMLVRKK
jgi:hypothetical protein